ncbi:MAG: 2Fe-2S iron-sulfur cluster binding domain-containing protein [Gammaproteobacteria bacterium]|nr:2Fe-2S iron-sulfur cluster binding domain-containing protein [Gammaproteobacteria bacterium]MBU1722337.1 2Fe-2S iron-sulfur cluster binding domain-containing protein [Gammaproteobacteria bacterium]MBU2004726.1 2Fe-2S iron-sulfur cluster binding domain-containing protein [Gammaproteobacteria bacterium]
MSYSVTILNTDWRFEVSEGETVLQAALRQEIPVPWGCGGGVCGVCMGQIVSGEMVYPDGEPLALFEEDADAGKGLFCVGLPASDLVLDVPEMGADWEPWEEE